MTLPAGSRLWLLHGACLYQHHHHPIIDTPIIITFCGYQHYIYLYISLFALSPEAYGCLPIAVAQAMRKQMSDCCVEPDMGVSLQVL